MYVDDKIFTNLEKRIFCCAASQFLQLRTKNFKLKKEQGRRKGGEVVSSL
jgi:hypothetical protein